jgi:dephospho-CoA kinase
VTRPFLLGLTGSIGMGKTTTARMFSEAGVPVWDADATVHALYAAGGPGSAALAPLVAEAVSAEGVDRTVLRAAIARDPALLAEIEAAIHPLVAADRQAFLRDHAQAPLAVLDIPLLFETGAEGSVDAVLVVTAAPDVQRARVLARPGMDEAAFRRILARQIPDAEKRRRADHVLHTDQGLERTRAEVLSMIRAIREERHARGRAGHGDHRA